VQGVSRCLVIHLDLIHIDSPRLMGMAFVVLNLEQAAKAAGGMMRLSAVVIDENMVIAAIAKEGSAQGPDGRRGLD